MKHYKIYGTDDAPYIKIKGKKVPFSKLFYTHDDYMIIEGKQHSFNIDYTDIPGEHHMLHVNTLYIGYDHIHKLANASEMIYIIMDETDLDYIYGEMVFINEKHNKPKIRRQVFKDIVSYIRDNNLNQ